MSTARITRVDELRAFLRFLKAQEVISKYEIVKNKSAKSVFGNKYTIKAYRSNNKITDDGIGDYSFRIMLESYFPGWAHMDGNKVVLKEELSVWNSLPADLKTLHPKPSYLLLHKMSRLEKFCDSQKLSVTSKMNQLKHLTRSYL